MSTLVELPKEKDSELELNKYTEFALRRYGFDVITERAIPDYRDGLKPVHRAILWAMAELNLRPNTSYKKAIRVVGDTNGKYHPHGDVSTYSSMVTIANTVPPLVDGEGNFGSPIDSAAHQRYTECRLSKFSQMFLLDSNYLDVVPYVPNFDGDFQIPLYLPSLIPTLLVIGNVLSPAYGVAAGNPEFTLISVAKVAAAALRGKPLTVDFLLKTLVIKNSYGSIPTDPSQLKALYETGKGSVTFCPFIETDYKAKKIYIKSYGAGFSSENTVEAKLTKISEMKGVSTITDNCGKKNPNAGNYGACYTVSPVRGSTPEDLYDLEMQLRKLLSAPEKYNLGITIRKSNPDDTLFKFMTFVSYFKAWAKFRIALETRFTNKQIEKRKAKLHIKEGMLIITGTQINLDKAIKIIREDDAPKVKLMSVFKLSEIQADAVLDIRLRSLAKVDVNLLKNEIQTLKNEIKEWTSYLEISGERAAADLVKRVNDYKKSPDTKVRSGLNPVE